MIPPKYQDTDFKPCSICGARERVDPTSGIIHAPQHDYDLHGIRPGLHQSTPPEKAQVHLNLSSGGAPGAVIKEIGDQAEQFAALDPGAAETIRSVTGVIADHVRAADAPTGAHVSVVLSLDVQLRFPSEPLVTSPGEPDTAPAAIQG